MIRVALGLALHVLLGSAAFAQEPGCLQSDEGKLTNHRCYLDSDNRPTHRPSTTADDVIRLPRVNQLAKKRTRP
jgi:hypothetical protein